jgi:hypothetical protein
VTGAARSTQRNTTKKVTTHLKHLLGASVDDALASLLHLVKETHDDVVFYSSFWNDTIEALFVVWK